MNDPAPACGHESKVSHRVRREAKPPRTTEKAFKALRAKRTTVSLWFSVAFASRRTRRWNLPLVHTRRCGPVRPIALNQSQYEADEGLASAEWPKCDAVLALLSPIVARQNQRIIERGWALKSKASWFFACGNCTARIRRRPDTGVLRGRSRRGHHASRIKSARTRQIRERIARFPTSCTREPHSAPGQIAPTAAEARQPSKAEVSHYGISRFR